MALGLFSSLSPTTSRPSMPPLRHTAVCSLHFPLPTPPCCLQPLSSPSAARVPACGRTFTFSVTRIWEHGGACLSSSCLCSSFCWLFSFTVKLINFPSSCSHLSHLRVSGRTEAFAFPWEIPLLGIPIRDCSLELGPCCYPPIWTGGPCRRSLRALLVVQ